MVAHAGGPFVIDAMVTRASMRARRRRASGRTRRSIVEEEPPRRGSRQRRRRQCRDKIRTDIIRSPIFVLSFPGPRAFNESSSSSRIFHRSSMTRRRVAPSREKIIEGFTLETSRVRFIAFSRDKYDSRVYQILDIYFSLFLDARSIRFLGFHVCLKSVYLLWRFSGRLFSSISDFVTARHSFVQ